MVHGGRLLFASKNSVTMDGVFRIRIILISGSITAFMMGGRLDSGIMNGEGRS